MNIRSNAFYEIPLEKEAEYAQAEVETSIAKGQCYCHISMHSEHEGHSATPCHFCVDEMHNEWPEMFTADDEAAGESPAEEFEISPLDLEIAASIIAYEIELGKIDAEWFGKKERKPA